MRLIIALLLTIFVAYLCREIYLDSLDRQELVFDNAEINHVKYGLLSAHSWKSQISDVLAHQIRDFQLSTNDRNELEENVEVALNQLIEMVEDLIEHKNKNSWLPKPISSFLQSLFFDLNHLKSEIPYLAKAIVEELDNYETRESLKRYLMDRVDNIIVSKGASSEQAILMSFSNKYPCLNPTGCKVFLHSEIEKKTNLLFTKSFLVVGLSALVFLLIFSGRRPIKRIDLAVIVPLSTILLVTGVSTPMIDLDARIQEFRFDILDSSVAFFDQVLFFQSKSILDIVQVLFLTDDYNSLFVGGLILLFSIILPLTKLLASFWLFGKDKTTQGVAAFFAIKTSKWSMADVFVVAIFMAYIGFKGLINSQLGQLEDLGKHVEILTTDHSGFGIGFIFFMAYCLAGILLAGRLEQSVRMLRKENLTN